MSRPARREDWIRFDPHQPCWVWAEGRWWPGRLRCWIQLADEEASTWGQDQRWWGTVNWYRGDNLQMHQTLPGHRLAPRVDDAEDPPPAPDGTDVIGATAE